MADELLSFEEIRNHPPLSRFSKRPDVSCLWRWHTKGIEVAGGRRVHLAAQRLGRFLYTSTSSVEAFLEQTQAGRTQQREVRARATPTCSTRSPRRRQRDREAAAERLKAAGI
jgi:hypothetical protein